MDILKVIESIMIFISRCAALAYQISMQLYVTLFYLLVTILFPSLQIRAS